MNKTKFKRTEISEIPEGWELRELGSLGRVVTGKTPPTKDVDNFGEGYPFITPRDMIGQKYIRIIEEMIQKNELETRALRNIRDSLLPKLMSGKIRVGIL